MLKGWVCFMYGEQEMLVVVGDCVYQVLGIVYYLFDYLLDMEYLEIVGFVDFKLIDVDGLCVVLELMLWGEVGVQLVEWVCVLDELFVFRWLMRWLFLFYMWVMLQGVFFFGEVIMYDVMLVGIDLGKYLFYFYGQDWYGKVVFCKKVNCKQLIEFFVKFYFCIVVMEVCVGVYYMVC